MEHRWGNGPPGSADLIDHLVYLSHLVGGEEDLTQPGGGNTSLKLDLAGADGAPRPTLVVKGSGSDLATVRREGFARLSLDQLGGLQDRAVMGDEDMLRFMRGCMTHPAEDPFPSVETPLHALLPFPVIVHVHDVATVALTNIPEEESRAILERLYHGEVVYVPYARPGHPLMLRAREVAGRLPKKAQGIHLAHHGLVTWGDTPEQCYERLITLVREAERFVAEHRGSRSVFGAVTVPALEPEERRRKAELLLPVLRGALGDPEPVVLHYDDSPAVLETLGGERFRELSQRGATTPDHILHAGRLPVHLALDWSAGDEELMRQAREGVARARADYREYHQRHAAPGEEPLADWAKTVLLPGLGMVTAFKDKRSARNANICYRAAMRCMEASEAVGTFTFLTEEQVYEFEHWPLERRKVEVAMQEEKRTLLLARRVALVMGGASGIGEGAVRQLVAAGAHVVVADLDEERSLALAEELGPRASAVCLDARDEESIAGAVAHTVHTFGGLDSLFYTVGVPPRFARITDIRREDLQRQVDVHYVGAVLALQQAARVMQRQGTGGSIICSVSKAALAPGKDAVAYGGSKAALQQALRVAALELGEDDIRVNAINADQVDTPLFRRFVQARADSKGRTFDEQLADYRSRNALGVSLIPAAAVGDLVVLLASDRFRYTTGDILTIDGGLSDAFPR